MSRCKTWTNWVQLLLVFSMIGQFNNVVRAAPKIGVGATTTLNTANVNTIYGGLVITTIRKPFEQPSWPGVRPAGMEQRLGYAVGDQPSDDQILFDVMLHSNNTPMLQEVILKTAGFLGKQLIDPQVLADGAYVLIPPTGGNLIGASLDDRKWLTTAFLDRSTNAAPDIFYQPDGVSHQPQSLVPTLSNFIAADDFRLVNEYVVSATYKDGAVNNWTELRRNAVVGSTPYEIRQAVKVKISLGKEMGNITLILPDMSVVSILRPIKIFNADPRTYTDPETVSAGKYNIVNPYEHDGVFPDKDNNGKIQGYSHRSASRIGPIIRPTENYIVYPYVPPPFYSEIYVHHAENSPGLPGLPAYPLDVSCVFSAEYESLQHAQPNGKLITWPTHDVYVYQPLLQSYTLDKTYKQIHSPWDGFMQASGLTRQP